ncbi:MAG TPA: ribosome small subunit-dependent GTPase A, partial [Acidimicrobiales bacterium]
DESAITAAASATLAPGVEVYVTSAVTGDGLDAIRALIAPGLTLVLMGPSGAGKSTLVNRLVGRESQRTEAVRAADGRGRHTTTTRDLIPVPGGGVLLDTPGLRGLGLWDAEQAVGDVFADVEQLGATCRFRDCRHDGEPGCTVQAAVDDGTLDDRRLSSYKKLQREMAALERQKDARAQRQVGRRFGKAMREVQKHKRR